MVDFKKIVEEQAAREKAAEADLAAVVQERGEWWPRQVHELLAQIQDWIRPLVDNGTLQYEVRKVTLNEEALGSYQVESAKIRFGSKTLSFEPMGTFLFGAFGRLDVTGPFGKVTLLLLGSDLNTATWHMAHPVAAPSTSRPPSTSQPRSTFASLTKDLFEKLFVDLLGIRS
jgi:hypothetical protein